MPTLLEQVCAPQTLAAAFRASLGSPGVWCGRTPMDWVRARPERHLLTLARDLAEGRYQSEPARRIEGFTADGRARAFTVYCVRDRVVQRALLRVVQPLGEALFVDTSYGYRPGLSVPMAVSRVREWLRPGPMWLLRGDVHRCFDSLSRGHALGLLRALTGDAPAAALVQGWLNQAPGAAAGLPMGMALSPFLCNLSLHGLDLCLRRHRLPMVRWADDLVVATPDEAGAHHAKAVIADHLGRIGLMLNPTKTVIAPSTARLRFLGQTLLSYPAPKAASMT